MGDAFDDIVSHLGPIADPRVAISAVEINDLCISLSECQFMLHQFMGTWLEDETVDMKDEAINVLHALSPLAAELVDLLEDCWDDDEDEDDTEC